MADADYNRKANMGLVSKFLENLAVTSRVGMSIAARELVPFSLWMLSAGKALTRAVSSVEVLSRKEKFAFEAHVNRLCALGLSYKSVTVASQFNGDNGGMEKVMRLEPNIEELVAFRHTKREFVAWRRQVPTPVSYQHC